MKNNKDLERIYDFIFDLLAFIFGVLIVAVILLIIPAIFTFAWNYGIVFIFPVLPKINIIIASCILIVVHMLYWK